MTANDAHVLLYGLRIDSELPLHVHRRATGDGLADVTIRVGADVAPTDREPAGRVLLDLEHGRRFYTAAAHDDGGYTLRCYGTCDFVVDARLRHVTVNRVPDAEPGLVSVLATGTLLSFLLTLRGAAVLHASAVQVDGSAIAFVGMSGMGKSTIATVMCADGAALVTDDVLRVDLDGAPGIPPACHAGTTEVRLRRSAQDFAALFDVPVVARRTADDRDALRLRSTGAARLPLAAIVFPVRQPDEHGRTTTVERLDSTSALLTMLRFPRLPGWSDAATIHRQFHELGELVDRVPVYTALLPWGPPRSREVAAAVRAAVAVDPDPAPARRGLRSRSPG